MTHVCCPKCSQKLMNGIGGNKVKTKCPVCKTEITASFNDEEMHLIFRSIDHLILKKAIKK